jgi:hypothetical protein
MNWTNSVSSASQSTHFILYGSLDSDSHETEMPILAMELLHCLSESSCAWKVKSLAPKLLFQSGIELGTIQASWALVPVMRQDIAKQIKGSR